MALITRQHTYSSGATILAAEHNTNENTVYTLCNGNIDTANISASAGIVDTQLAQITTASKVSTSAITGSYGNVNLTEGSAPSTAASEGALYTKDTSGQPELFFREESDGDEVQMTSGGLFPLMGYSTGLSIFRRTLLRIEPGGTPGTNINVTEVDASGVNYNNPTITDGTNIAKSGSSGSFALSADGTNITMDLTEDIVGVMFAFYSTHDVKNSSTTAGDIFFPNILTSSNNMLIQTFQTGSQSQADWTTVLSTAGDRVSIQLGFITSS